MVNRGGETSRNEPSESESGETRDARRVSVHDPPLIRFTTVVPPD